MKKLSLALALLLLSPTAPLWANSSAFPAITPAPPTFQQPPNFLSNINNIPAPSGTFLPTPTPTSVDQMPPPAILALVLALTIIAILYLRTERNRTPSKNRAP